MHLWYSFLSKYFPFFDHPHKKSKKKSLSWIKAFCHSSLKMSPVLYWLWGVLASTLYWYSIEESLHLFFLESLLLIEWLALAAVLFETFVYLFIFCFLVCYTLLIFHLSILFLFFTWVSLKLLLADGIASSAPCVLWKHLCICSLGVFVLEYLAWFVGPFAYCNSLLGSFPLLL